MKRSTKGRPPLRCHRKRRRRYCQRTAPRGNSETVSCRVVCTDRLEWLVVGERADGSRLVLAEAPTKEAGERQARRFRRHLENYVLIEVEWCPRGDPRRGVRD